MSQYRRYLAFSHCGLRQPLYSTRIRLPLQAFLRWNNTSAQIYGKTYSSASFVLLSRMLYVSPSFVLSTACLSLPFAGLVMDTENGRT